jgi:hypothetical protein
MAEPSGRKEPKPFEPPPWEQDQFEELARRRAEQESLEAETPAREQETLPETAGPPEAPERVEQQEASTGSGEAPGTATEGTSAQERPDLDETKLKEMMFQLRAEEPPAARGLWQVGMAAAAFMVVLGAVMMVWGIVALQATRGAGPLGAMGAAIMLLFGMGFIAIAAWMAMRSYRQRGA